MQRVATSPWGRLSSMLAWAAVLLLATRAADAGGMKEINPPDAPEETKTFALVGGRLIDGRGGPPVADAVIVVRGTKILAAGPRDKIVIPADAQTTDISGFSVLPGLIDSHFHSANDVKTPVEYELRHGVTSFRDPGHPFRFYNAVRQTELTMPRVFLCGAHLDAHPPVWPDQAVVVQDADHARRTVRAHVDRGASAIKVYFRLPLEHIEAACEAATERGVLVTALTQAGQIMGTVDYMSPEQAEETRDVDARADQYSLGCTLWVLLTGRPMFAGTTTIAKLMAHRTQPAPSLRAARADVPEALEAIYLKMVAKEPDDRYASMDEVIAALATALGEAALAQLDGPSSSDSKLTEFFKQIAGAATAAPPRSTTAVDAETMQRLPVKEETGTEHIDLAARPLSVSPVVPSPAAAASASAKPAAGAASPSATPKAARRQLHPLVLPAALVIGGIGSIGGAACAVVVAGASRQPVRLGGGRGRRPRPPRDGQRPVR